MHQGNSTNPNPFFYEGDFRWLRVQEGCRLSNSKRRKALKRTAFGRVRIYAVSLSIVRPLRCREMRIVLKFADRHLLLNQNDILKQFTVLVCA